MAIPSIAVGCLAGFVVVKHTLEGFQQIDARRFIPFLGWIGVYVVYAVSVTIQHETADNIKYLMQFRTMLPVYATVILLLPAFTQKQFFVFFKAYIAMTVVLCWVVLYNYCYLILLHHGDAFIHPTWRNFIDMLYPFIIPCKIIHHTFSFFLLFACILIYYILRQKKELAPTKVVLIIAFVFLAFMLHFISSRLSLLMFYVGIVAEVTRLTFTKAITIKWSLSIVAASMVAAAGLYLTIPTLRNKINFTVLDKAAPEEIVKTESADKNIRLISLQVGLQAIKENMWTGISFGNEIAYFKTLNAQYFHEDALLNMRPHNQFLYNAATLGLPLGLLFVFFFFFPLIYKFDTSHFLLLLLYVSMVAYFFTDNPLQQKQFFYFVAFWVPFLKLYAIENIKNSNNASAKQQDGKVV